MNLPDLSIRRYVLAFMLSGVLVLFGVISYQRLGIDRFPYIELPAVGITTTLAGANPEIVDSSITNVIETAINSVPGIEHIQSSSLPGISIVGIFFDLDKNIDVAYSEVQAKINQILPSLPKDAKPPQVFKVLTGTQPVMWLALSGDRTLQQLNLYARNVIKKRLETIAGVGQVLIGGERERVIRIALDMARLSALGLTARDVLNALAREHIQLPGGFLVSQQTERILKLDMEFHSTDELTQMVVAYRDGAPVKLQDVASVEDGLSDFRKLARYNGKPTVGLGIVKITNGNAVAVVEAVKKRLEKDIIPNLPPGMMLEIASNDALFIQQLVDTLKEHLLEGTLLASLIVLLFLRSLRSTLIIAIAIPVSLLGAIAVIYFAGFTLNTLTLLALLLLVGVVVDDSIVVLENIYRHRTQLNADPLSAALNGSREVFFAVLAATLSLVAIFAPVIFMGGIVGKFFNSFAVVVTFGVLVSWFVSLTLTPMLCSLFLKVGEHGRVYRLLGVFFTGLENLYSNLLRLALAHRWKVVLLTIMIVLSSGYFFANIGKGFAPEEDEGRFLVTFKTPLGSNIEYTQDRLTKIEAALRKHTEIEGFFSVVGSGQGGRVNEGTIFVRLTPREQRHLHQYKLMGLLRDDLARIPGVEAYAAPVPIVSGDRGEPLGFVLSGPSLSEVARLAQSLESRLEAQPGLGKLDLDLQLNMPQVEVKIDRVRAASLGLSAQDIGLALNILAGGVDVGKYNDLPGDGERYDVRLKAREASLTQAPDLSRIYLHARGGERVRLDTVAKFEETLGPAVISRYDLQYAATFFGSPSIPLGEAVTRVKREAAALLPAGYRVQMLGQAEEFGKTVSNMIFAFALALVLLYMVLASQFNSFIQPLIIMIAQPLAIIGGVLALWLTGLSLNIYSMIGLVLLIGLVAKNSILLVDLTNQYRAAGKPVNEALSTACPIRMRPVLMTSLTIIFALSPAALGLGAGGDTNAPLAVAVIGGMLSSTLLTLVVVPAVYSLVENGLERWRKRGAVVVT
ncbi:MAG: efflux RND transporter permease subunit [Gammaproteobacteria bacterium]